MSDREVVRGHGQVVPVPEPGGQVYRTLLIQKAGVVAELASRETQVDQGVAHDVLGSDLLGQREATSTPVEAVREEIAHDELGPDGRHGKGQGAARRQRLDALE